MTLTKHGRYKYIKDKCRCKTCTDDHSVMRRTYKWRRLERFLDDGTITLDEVGWRINNNKNCPHGTDSGYNYWWCRCPVCRAFNANSSKNKKKVV